MITASTFQIPFAAWMDWTYSNRAFYTLKFDLFGQFLLSKAMSSGNGQGGSSAAWGNLPPVRSGAAVAGEGGSSIQQPPDAVDANVIEIERPKWQKFTVIEPSVPEMPGNSLPYPTADIRRGMNHPNCTAIGNEVILYGYFWNTEANRKDFFGPHGVSNKQVPPFHDEQNYISLRASPAECLDRSTWGRGKKEYVLDRDLCFYEIRFSKLGDKWLFQQHIIKELGKGVQSQKQWIHLQKQTNVKSKADYNGFLLWEAKLLSKPEIEALAGVPPSAPPHPSLQSMASSLPPPVASAPAGIWRSPAM